MIFAIRMNKRSDDCDTRLLSYVSGPPSSLVGPVARSRQVYIELEMMEVLLAIFLPEERRTFIQTSDLP